MTTTTDTRSALVRALVLNDTAHPEDRARTGNPLLSDDQVTVYHPDGYTGRIKQCVVRPDRLVLTTDLGVSPSGTRTTPMSFLDTTTDDTLLAGLRRWYAKNHVARHSQAAGFRAGYID